MSSQRDDTVVVIIASAAVILAAVVFFLILAQQNRAGFADAAAPCCGDVVGNGTSTTTVVNNTFVEVINNTNPFDPSTLLLNETQVTCAGPLEETCIPNSFPTLSIDALLVNSTTCGAPVDASCLPDTLTNTILNNATCTAPLPEACVPACSCDLTGLTCPTPIIPGSCIQGNVTAEIPCDLDVCSVRIQQPSGELIVGGPGIAPFGVVLLGNPNDNTHVIAFAGAHALSTLLLGRNELSASTVNGPLTLTANGPAQPAIFESTNGLTTVRGPEVRVESSANGIDIINLSNDPTEITSNNETRVSSGTLYQNSAQVHRWNDPLGNPIFGTSAESQDCNQNLVPEYSFRAFKSVIMEIGTFIGSVEDRVLVQGLDLCNPVISSLGSTLVLDAPKVNATDICADEVTATVVDAPTGLFGNLTVSSNVINGYDLDVCCAPPPTMMRKRQEDLLGRVLMLESRLEELTKKIEAFEKTAPPAQ